MILIFKDSPRRFLKVLKEVQQVFTTLLFVSHIIFTNKSGKKGKKIPVEIRSPVCFFCLVWLNEFGRRPVVST